MKCYGSNVAAKGIGNQINPFLVKAFGEIFRPLNDVGDVIVERQHIWGDRRRIGASGAALVIGREDKRVGQGQ